MTTTPTSGAADLPDAMRSIQRFEVVDCIDDKHVPAVIPNPHGPWVRYEDHIAALAAGQATAAPAEPDPTPGDHPPPCDSELFESGVSVGLFDMPKWTAEALCKGIAAATGARVDWHYIGGRVHVKALPASADGAAYAALPDEREMLKHALWLASSFTVHRYLMSNAEGRWSGAEKATCHDELCCMYVAVFRGVEVDQVRVDLEADWIAVHDATQELTDHMDAVIGFPLKGVPDYDALAPKFFDHFHRLATHTLRASHRQAPATQQAGAEPPGIQALMCVISSLRDMAHFSDEEGCELMSALCALRDWAHAQPAPATQQVGEVRRAELVPGVMHCAKCKFQLNLVTLCVSDGNAYAGNNKTEPCPNGCGPLWPVTWEQEAKNCWKALEEMHERLMAAAAPQPSPTTQAGEPFGYFHQLLNHEGKGNGVWLGAAERKVVEQAHTPGETSEEIAALYTTPQPTQARAGAVPLDEARRLFDAGWKAAALFCDREDVVADGIIGFGASPQFEAAFSAANGIKGGQHVE